MCQLSKMNDDLPRADTSLANSKASEAIDHGCIKGSYLVVNFLLSWPV